MTVEGEEDIVVRLLHTADWHLGKRFPSFSEDQNRRLMQARLAVLDRIVAAAERFTVDAVLCAGDLFDDPVLGPRLGLRSSSAGGRNSVHTERREAREVDRGRQQAEVLTDARLAAHAGRRPPCRRRIRWAILRSTLGRVAR